MSLADFASGVFGGGNARALTAEPFSSASSTQRRDHVEHRGSWPKTRAMVTRRGSGLVISLVYKSLSGNMLTPDGVGLVHAVESELTRFATSRGETVEWQSVCLYAFPPFGRYSDTNASVSMHQIQVRVWSDTILASASECIVFQWSGRASSVFLRSHRNPLPLRV